MENENKQRGYDDSSLLKRMADGLVLRQFSSVDEAAKAVLLEDGGSNVDRLRRKFREQDWYEKGLASYVDQEVEKRGLMTPNFGARLCVAVEQAFCDPVPTARRLALLVHVLAFRRFDIDGRPITLKERIGGALRIYGSLLVIVTAISAFISFVRMDYQGFGWEMIGLSVSMFVLWLGMVWNRVSIRGDLTAFEQADAHWRRLRLKRVIALMEPDQNSSLKPDAQQ